MDNQVAVVGETGISKHVSPLLRVALLLGVTVHLLGFFIFRVVSDPLPSRENSPAFITMVSTDPGGDASELIEQASLFDSAPLFIPGEWSSASGMFASSADQDWEVFRDFEPSIILSDEVRPIRLSLPQAADVKEPSDLLDFRFWDLFRYFGQKDTPVEVFDGPNSVAVVSILAGGEKPTAGTDIRLEVSLSSEAIAARPIIVFLNLAAPGFPLGAPVLNQSSGSDALDLEVLQWLTQPDTLAKLPAGFLQLRVFP